MNTGLMQMRYMSVGNGWIGISSDVMYYPNSAFLFITTDNGIDTDIVGFYVDDCGISLVPNVHVFETKIRV